MTAESDVGFELPPRGNVVRGALADEFLYLRIDESNGRNAADVKLVSDVTTTARSER
jgi:hypothetical protein